MSADQRIAEPAADDRPGDIVPLSRRGRAARTVAAALVLLLITLGTVHGSDDDFPFGPPRMYATRDDPNGQIVQAVILASTSDGQTFDVTETGGAPRRAELEGRFDEFADRPAEFAMVATQYVNSAERLRDHPSETATQIRLVRRVFHLHDGRRVTTVDETVARWTPR